MSSPRQPAGIASAATVCVCASALKASAATASVGSSSAVPVCRAFSIRPRQSSSFSSSQRLSPIAPPCALIKVKAMLYDAKVAQEFAARMLKKGVYVVGFFYPVVPQGKARIRTQVSAGHSKADLDFAVQCFKEVKEEMGI